MIQKTIVVGPLQCNCALLACRHVVDGSVDGLVAEREHAVSAVLNRFGMLPL